jgi:hypothetical protein
MLRFVLFAALSASAQQMRLDLAEKLGPLEIDHMALGQSGLSEQPMWEIYTKGRFPSSTSSATVMLFAMRLKANISNELSLAAGAKS